MWSGMANSLDPLEDPLKMIFLTFGIHHSASFLVYLQIIGHSWFKVLTGFVEVDGVRGLDDFDTIKLRHYHIST